RANPTQPYAELNVAAGRIETGTGTLTVNGNITNHANAATATISGQLNLGGLTRTLDVSASGAAVGLEIYDVVSNGGITKSGSGTLTLSGANTYTGATTSSAGTVELSSPGALSSARNIQ